MLLLLLLLLVVVVEVVVVVVDVVVVVVVVGGGGGYGDHLMHINSSTKLHVPVFYNLPECVISHASYKPDLAIQFQFSCNKHNKYTYLTFFLGLCNV